MGDKKGGEEVENTTGGFIKDNCILVQGCFGSRHGERILGSVAIQSTAKPIKAERLLYGKYVFTGWPVALWSPRHDECI